MLKSLLLATILALSTMSAPREVQAGEYDDFFACAALVTATDFFAIAAEVLCNAAVAAPIPAKV